MWHQMLQRLDDFDAGRVGLGQLVSDLRGLFVAADSHDPRVRSEFEALWGFIDGEHELRTQPWAPPGSASDENLAASLRDLRQWVEQVVLVDPSPEHD